MRTFVLALAAVALGAAASAQTAPATLRLSVDDAVKMALDDNVDLRADRLDPQISDTRVAAASGVFRPTIVTALNSNNQLQPPSSFLVPAATKTDVVTTNAGLSQRLPRFGTSYSLGWTMAHILRGGIAALTKEKTIWTDILLHVSYLDLWTETLQGKLVPKFLLFPSSLTVFSLFLSVKVLEARKWK